jgi:hypothetical protein
MEENLKDRVQSLEERVNYLESVIKGFVHSLTHSQSQGQSQIQNHSHAYTPIPHDFDDVLTNITITHEHLTRVLESSMEEQIICIITEENKKTPFMKMAKDLCKYKNGWIHMDDSDLKLLIQTIEHKILLLHSTCSNNPEKCFDNNTIIYGLNLIGRFKKIKNKLIDNI